MTHAKLVPIRFENALWEGQLTAASEPRVEARYLGEVLPGVEVTPNDAGWMLRVPVPPALLSDGVHCVTIWDCERQSKLGDFSVISGAPASGDIRTELELLRAELDMLKRVVRRMNQG